MSRLVDADPTVKGHRRFALHDVTIGGLPVGGATVDAWHDRGDVQHWLARLLMPRSHPLGAGLLAGTDRGGQRISGPVRVGETMTGVRRGRELLVEFHGDGPLVVES